MVFQDLSLFFLYFIAGSSILSLFLIWIWAIIHAYRTPGVSLSQRGLWVLSIFFNPTATIWYWCVWKRQLFWMLFTPLFGFFISLPLIIRSLMNKAQSTNITNLLFALGSNKLMIFLGVVLIFPLLLKLIVILDITKNKKMSFLERNNWVVSIAIPSLGIGVSFFYAVKYLKHWAYLTLVWLVLFGGLLKIIVWNNLRPVIIPIGEEKREIYHQHHSN